MQVRKWGFILLIAIAGEAMAQKNVKPKRDDKEVRASLVKQLKPNNQFRTQLYGNSLARNLNRVDKEASGIRKESIKAIVDVLPKTTDARQKFELRRRLVDLYLEQGQYIEEMEMRKYQADYKAWSEAKVKKVSEPVLNNDRSQQIYEQAEKVLRLIVKESLDRKEVVYSLLDLGDILTRKQNEEAPQFYKMVVTKHKDSPMLSEAYLSLGEYYFDRANWSEASLWYQRLLMMHQDKYYPYAAYKLGWVNYNLPAEQPDDQKKYFDKSAAAFKLVIKYAEKSKKGTALYDLRESAMNDLVMVWADAQDIQAAYDFFSKLDSLEKYYLVLERMALTFVDQGNTQNAIKIFEKLLTEAPLRKNNPDLHAQLASQYEIRGQLKTLFATLNKMIFLYINPQAKWRETHKNDAAVLKEGEDKVEFTTRIWATTYHQAYNTKNRDEYLKFASMTYALYLKHFSKHENAYEMRYYFADTLRSLKKPLPSGKQFFMVVNMNRKDGKYLKDSSNSAVDQFFAATKSKKFPNEPKRGEAKSAQKIPEEKKLLIEAIDSHVSLFPKEKDIPYMRFEAADIHFVYGHYEEAIKRYTTIVKDFPKEKQAKSSVDIVLAYYSRSESWLSLIAICKDFLTVKDLPEDVKKFTKETLVGASFNYASLLEKEKKYEESAQRFVQFYKDFKEDKNASRALYNATLNYRRAMNYPAFFQYGQELFDQFPQFPQLGDLILLMAQTYEGIADYSNAARYYDLYSRRWPDKQTSLVAMYNASILYAGLKFFEQASKIVDLMSRMYPKAELTQKARDSLPKLYEESGELGKAIDLYKRSLEENPRKLGEEALNLRAKIMMLEAQNAQRSVDERDLNALIKDLGRSKEGVEARKTAGKILFDRTTPQFQKFATLKIRGDQNLEKDAEVKNQALASLVKSYQRVIAVGHPEYLIAALIRMGDAHVEFGNSLLSSPVDLNGGLKEVNEQFDPIREVAMQLIRDGMEFYKEANKRAQELKYVSNWTNKSRELLSEYFPLEFGKFNEPFLEFQFNYVR